MIVKINEDLQNCQTNKNISVWVLKQNLSLPMWVVS